MSKYEESPYFCPCAQRRLAWRVHANGVRVYGRQCMNCGNFQCVKTASLSEQEKRAAVEYDQDLSTRFYERIRLQQDVKRQAESDAWWDDYTRHLASEKWRRLRDKVLRRAGWICEGCGERRAERVHHTTYQHLGDEMLWELKAVCLECHAKIHPRKDLR